MALPATGDLNWGVPLNTDITALQAEADAVTAGLANHSANSPADPHGDRAYALGLLGPLTTNLNLPNGLVQLTGAGKIPANLAPTGGGLTNFIDVKKDFGATGNGSTDDSGDINNALAAATASGGGIVWVPDGNYACGSPLVIGSGTWLLLSPGAVITRIQNPTSPPVMLANYTTGVSPATGNIKVSGGSWNAVGSGLTQTCAPFSFVNANNITIENVLVTNVPNGNSAFVQLFGCTNVWVENLEFTGAGPSGGRGAQNQPCVRFDETNSIYISGLVGSAYSGSPNCFNITVKGCQLVAATAADGFGNYTAWTAMTGSSSTVSGVHASITVVNNSASGLATAGVVGTGWNKVTYTGNNLNYPPASYVMNSGGLDMRLEGNAASSFPVQIGNTVSNTVTEKILAQFAIPANDWIPGSTGYQFRLTGLISWATSNLITFRMYLGTNGSLGDPQVSGNQAVTFTSGPQGPVIFNMVGRGIYVDSGGNFWSGGWDFLSQMFSTQIGTVSTSPLSGQTLWITISAQWNSAISGNTTHALVGSCERIRT